MGNPALLYGTAEGLDRRLSCWHKQSAGHSPRLGRHDDRGTMQTVLNVLSTVSLSLEVADKYLVGIGALVAFLIAAAALARAGVFLANWRKN